MRTSIALVALALVALAAAAPPAAAEPRPMIDSFGFRVGGYGFRNPEGDRRNAWDDCRMNGIGAFATRNAGRYGFLEAGLDMYFSERFPQAADAAEGGMDRLSGLATVAAGLRMFPGAKVSPYIQAGLGLEATHVEMGLGHEQAGAAPAAGEAATVHHGSFVMPLGFLGVGGDVGVGDHLRLGMAARFHLMGHFDHHDPTAAMTASPEAAAQVQFYASYAL